MEQELANTLQKLSEQDYVADPEIAMSLYLMVKLNRPLLIEGEAGVGKTEIAKVLAKIKRAPFIRLQCYEGLDHHSALYEWNYQKQILHIRQSEHGNGSLEQKDGNIFGEEFLLKRPIVEALTCDERCVLLIDEIDRSDEEFEALLLEVLAEHQVTIPEFGTVRARFEPYVVLTSNRTRELSDALRRRCLYLWIDYPEMSKELEIVLRKVPGIRPELAEEIVHFIQNVRREPLHKIPGVAETIDWAMALRQLGIVSLTEESVAMTAGCFLKDRDDVDAMRKGLVQRFVRKANDL